MWTTDKINLKKRVFIFWKRLLHTSTNLTIHGPNFLSRPSVHYIFKILYVFFVIFTFWNLYQSIFDTYKNYKASKVRFSARTDYLRWNTTFPSVTVCEILNPDKVSAISQFISNGPKNISLERYLSEISFYSGTCYTCESCQSEKECPTNYDELLEVFRNSCPKLLQQCSFNGVPFDCCSKFLHLQTEYGKCFSINSKHSKSLYSFLTVNRNTGVGPLQFTTLQDTEIFIHGGEDVPFWDMEYDRRLMVPFGSQAKVTFSVTETSNDPDVKSLNPEIRQCRFDDEINAKIVGYHVYSYSVCVIHCRIKEQLKLCNCTNHLSPKMFMDKYCDIDGLICLTRNYEHLRRIKKSEDNDLNSDDLTCNCLPSCTESEYNIIEKQVLVPQKELGPKGITLSFTHLPYGRWVRQVARTDLDFVVTIGNSFGLCFGGSILSLVEIFYYLCWKRWRYTRVNSETNTIFVISKK